MPDHDLPDLPSDKDLGIEGESIEDYLDEPEAPTPSEGPPPEGSPSDPPPRPKGRADTPPPPAVAGPARWRGVITLGVLIALAWAASPSRTLPRPVPANQSDTVFSSGRAMAHLVEIARAPHPTGSPEHTRVREWLVGRLTDMGLEPEVQTSTVVRRRGGALIAATVRNIVARVPGTGSTGAVLLTAHYDAVPSSLGAADDGTGVVAVLEAVRALRAGPPLQNDLIVLITDAEEIGLLGARAFVDEHPWMADVSIVLSVEMRGGGGPSIMFETGADNGRVVRTLAEASPGAYANSLSFEVYRRLPNDTDFTPFLEAGKQGLNFAAVGRPNVYHQATDAPGNLDEATLQHHGDNLLRTARAFALDDLSDVGSPDVVFVHLPLLGIVVYPSNWTLPIAGALLLLALLVAVWSRRRGARASGWAVGAVLGLATVGLTAATGWALFGWARPFHPEYGALTPAFHSEGWYLLALVAGGFVLTTALFGIARRWYSIGELSLGAAVLPLAGAIVAAFMVPLAAMNLLWPALAGVLAVAWVSGLGPEQTPGWVGWAGLLVLSVPVLAFLVPVTELVWIGMSFAQAVALGLLVTLTLLLLLPVLDTLSAPNRWWAPVLGLLSVAAFLGMSFVAARPSPERPIPTALVYTLDRTSGEALWATRGEAGLEWAQERAGVLEDKRSLSAFLLGDAEFSVGPAPVIDAPLPELSLTADSAAAADGVLRIGLSSQIGAEVLAIRLGETLGGALLAINGKALPPTAEGAGPPSVLYHWGIPDGLLTLDFATTAGPALELDVIERHLRPGELVGEEAFRRAPDQAPHRRIPSDMVLVRTELRLLPDADTVAADTVTAGPGG